MNWHIALNIALATAIANLIRAGYHKWKYSRTIIPAYRNWKGEYVPDLHLIRLKRGLIVAWLLTIILGIPLGYLMLKGVQLPSK